MASGGLLRAAARDLRGNRVRTSLTAVSLFVAVLSVTGIVTVSAVTGDVLLAQAEQRSGRAVTEAVTVAPAQAQLRGVPALVAGLAAEAARGHGHDAAVALAPATLAPAGGLPAPVTLTLTAGRLQDIRRLPLVAGSWYPAAGGPEPVLVVNLVAARALGGARTVTLALGSGGALRARVVGTVADGSQAATYYSPLAATLARQPDAVHDAATTLLLQVPGQTEPALRAALQRVLAGALVDPDSTEISRADTTADLARSIGDTRTGFLVVAAAALLAAVLGLLNVGLASVRERRHELALRRATGATRGWVLRLVLLSAALTGLGAGLAAVAVGVLGIDVVLPDLLGTASGLQPPAFPWSAGVVGLVVGLVAALVGAAAPAAAAARSDVAGLLR